MKYKLEFKKSLYCAMGFLASCLAYGEDMVQTKHGVLSIAGDFRQNKLMLNGRIISLPGGDADYASLGIVGKYVVSNGDVVLIGDSASATCQLYRFVTLSKSNPMVTPAFGTCDDNPRVSQDGDQITLKVKNKKSKVETFTYLGGVVKMNEKILK